KAPPTPTTTLFPTRRSSDLETRTSRQRVFCDCRRAACVSPSPGSNKEVRDGCLSEFSAGRRDAAGRGHHAQPAGAAQRAFHGPRSEEHTSELQSLAYLVCRF